MKTKLAVVALAVAACAPMLAAAAVSHPIAYPPGPSIWSFLAFLFGG
jgi:hypothetical protein